MTAYGDIWQEQNSAWHHVGPCHAWWHMVACGGTWWHVAAVQLHVVSHGSRHGGSPTPYGTTLVHAWQHVAAGYATPEQPIPAIALCVTSTERTY